MKKFIGFCFVIALAAGCGTSSDACTDFCTHSATCAGHPTNGCGAACVDPALFNPYGGTCTDYPTYYNCLNGISCSDLTTDAGVNSDAVVACKSAGHCQ